MGWRRQESRAESILGTSVPWYAAAAAGRRFYVSHTLAIPYLCETQVNSVSLQTPLCHSAALTTRIKDRNCIYSYLNLHNNVQL